MAWDPERYLEFEDQRLRPALELLARVPFRGPGRVVDLGCGAGNVTTILADRWPAAEVIGIDASAAMIERARRDHPGLRFEEQDITGWEPEAPVDVLYSNAALHWLDDHDQLFPRLFRALAPGGVLAVQMPHNHHDPSHTAAVDLARGGPWRDRLEPVLRPHPVEEPAFYFDLLAPLAATVDLWETVYHQVMEGEDPVARWTRGSMLRPLLAALEPGETFEFMAAYQERLREAYPPRPDGRTLFPFRRQFLVAVAPT